MKKRRVGILAIAAAVFVLSGTVQADEETEPEDYVVCTVNGEEVYDSTFAETYQYYEETFAAAGYDTEDQETAEYLRECAWNAAVNDVLMRQGLEEDGYYDASDGEENGFSQAFAQFQEDLESRISIGEEEVREYYDQLVTQDEETYADDIAAYEYVKYYTNADLWYIPEGYRQILQIVLNADDEAIEDKEKDIFERTEAGEDFRELVKEYTIDETATEDEVLEQGYFIHQDSVVWSEQMIQAAFSEEMKEPGDLTTFTDDSGVHILYYVGDLDCGPSPEYTDSVEEYVLEKMEREKLQELSDEYLDSLYGQAVILRIADPSYLDGKEEEIAGEDSE